MIVKVVVSVIKFILRFFFYSVNRVKFADPSFRGDDVLPRTDQRTTTKGRRSAKLPVRLAHPTGRGIRMSWSLILDGSATTATASAGV